MDASALTVSPLRFVFDAKPGEEIAGSVKLTNESGVRETYYPVVQDFVASEDEGGTPNFLEEGVVTATSIAHWVFFDTASVTLEPGETRYVAFKLRVPIDAQAGGYYGGLLFSTVAPEVREGVTIGTKVGPLVLVSVSGDVKEEGSLIEFSAAPSTVSRLPLTFQYRFQNTGSIHLQPAGVIRITNMLGGGTATIPVNVDGGSVLPSSIRRFDVPWQKNEVPEDSAEIVKEWKNFGFGRYTATLTLNFGTENTTASAVTTFWVVPWQIIILALFVVVIIVLLIRRRNRAVIYRGQRQT